MAKAATGTKKRTTAKKKTGAAAIQTVGDDTPKGPNKSQAIRDFLAANADAKPKAVVEALAADGITVSPNMVSMIKSKGPKVGKRGRKAGKATGKASKASAATGAVGAIEAAQALVRASGNTESAIKILEAIQAMTG